MLKSLGACFLGPRAENRAEFNSLVISTLNQYEDCRFWNQPLDVPSITKEVKDSSTYRKQIRNLSDNLLHLNQMLKDSVPFFNLRYVVSLFSFALFHSLLRFAINFCFVLFCSFYESLFYENGIALPFLSNISVPESEKSIHYLLKPK